MFSSLANSNTGINVAKIMINPPIVGVPAFSFCPFNPKSLIDSPICLTLRNSITFFPKIVEINSAVIKAVADLKEIYPNNDAPGN